MHKAIVYLSVKHSNFLVFNHFSTFILGNLCVRLSSFYCRLKLNYLDVYEQ